jgi:hypothetical protein
MRQIYRLLLLIFCGYVDIVLALAVSKPTMETTAHSNSTGLVHGHGHHHLPDLDGTKTSDEVIILILGAIVFLTFALGLAFQVRSPSPRNQSIQTRKHPAKTPPLDSCAINRYGSSDGNSWPGKKGKSMKTLKTLVMTVARSIKWQSSTSKPPLPLPLRR